MMATADRPLRPVEFQIMLVLAEGDAHGYAIMMETEERTGGALRLEPGTLYRALRRLTASGLIEESGQRPAPDVDDQRRRYFSLTKHGRTVASQEARRLAHLVEQAHASQLLEPRDS